MELFSSAYSDEAFVQDIEHSTRGIEQVLHAINNTNKYHTRHTLLDPSLDLQK